MSHLRIKTKYNSEGNYGSVDEYDVYCHHNLSSDYVTFYDDDGSIIFTIPDTIDNNLLEAIIRLYSPYKKDSNKLLDGIEHMNENDIKKC
jgi:hypothetical protein